MSMTELEMIALRLLPSWLADRGLPTSAAVTTKAADLIEAMAQELAEEKEAREVILVMRETWIRRCEDAESRLADSEKALQQRKYCNATQQFDCQTLGDCNDNGCVRLITKQAIDNP